MIPKDPLYLALTRPALTWGVPLEAFLCNLFGTFVIGAEFQGDTLWRSPMMFWAAAVPIHFALRELTAWDYHWCRQIMLWATTVLHPDLDSLPVNPPANSKGILSCVQAHFDR